VELVHTSSSKLRHLYTLNKLVFYLFTHLSYYSFNYDCGWSGYSTWSCCGSSHKVYYYRGRTELWRSIWRSYHGISHTGWWQGTNR